MYVLDIIILLCCVQLSITALFEAVLTRVDKVVVYLALFSLYVWLVGIVCMACGNVC